MSRLPIYEDEIVAGSRRGQETWVKIAKFSKKLLLILVLLSYIIGISLSSFLIVDEKYASWVSTSLNLQITTILLAILAAFIVPTLRRVREEMREYDQLLDEYNFRLWELKLRKDISDEKRQNMRNLIQNTLSRTQSRYGAPAAERVTLKLSVWVIFIGLIFSLVFTFSAIILESSLLAKICWVFLMASIILIFGHIPIVARHY